MADSTEPGSARSSPERTARISPLAQRSSRTRSNSATGLVATRPNVSSRRLICRARRSASGGVSGNPAHRNAARPNAVEVSS